MMCIFLNKSTLNTFVKKNHMQERILQFLNLSKIRFKKSDKNICIIMLTYNIFPIEDCTSFLQSSTKVGD